MALPSITQTELDTIILSIANYFVDLTTKAAKLRRQNDPAAWKREREMIALHNYYTSLLFYDVSSGIMTDDELRRIIEYATRLIESCPS